MSLYCKALLNEREGRNYRLKTPQDLDEEYEKENKEWQWEEFSKFAGDLNNVFSDFGLNVYLTQNGFIPKQEEKIINEIYEPVIKCLSDSKWEKVNNLLRDAFLKYRENTPSGYSTCVTHTVAGVEAFLQIVVRGKAGEGDFAGLVSEGQRNGLLSNDMFTKEMFKTIISILMRERKETGDAHVKQSYATERNAKMVLNLAMVLYSIVS